MCTCVRMYVYTLPGRAQAGLGWARVFFLKDIPSLPWAWSPPRVLAEPLQLSNMGKEGAGKKLFPERSLPPTRSWGDYREERSLEV